MTITEFYRIIILINTTGAPAVFFCVLVKGIKMFDVIGQTVRGFSQIRFGPWQGLGDILLVGEGNLSFAKSLIRQPISQINYMVATTYETKKNTSDEAQENASDLQQLGANVIYGVDGTKLEKSIRPHEFETIVFQFPNIGSRNARYGQNPNHIMIREFLRSAIPFLKPDGKILITVVENPHYQGRIQTGRCC